MNTALSSNNDHLPESRNKNLGKENSLHRMESDFIREQNLNKHYKAEELQKNLNPPYNP